MKLKCIETGKTTRIVLGEAWENDEILDTAANVLLRRELEHKKDFVCISVDNLRGEICHALHDLTEHSGEYRNFQIV